MYYKSKRKPTPKKEITPFRKSKSREHINWLKATLPFRRSGRWPKGTKNMSKGEFLDYMDQRNKKLEENIKGLPDKLRKMSKEERKKFQEEREACRRAVRYVGEQEQKILADAWEKMLSKGSSIPEYLHYLDQQYNKAGVYRKGHAIRKRTEVERKKLQEERKKLQEEREARRDPKLKILENAEMVGYKEGDDDPEKGQGSKEGDDA